MSKRPKRRVFHLIKSLGRGGAETLLVQGLAAGDRRRFEFRYGYFFSWKDALVRDLEQQGVTVQCFNAAGNRQLLGCVLAVSRALREWQADVLHCHLPLAGVVGRLAGTIARVPVIYTEHNVMERYHPWTRRLNVVTWRLQRHVIAVSEEVAKAASRHAGARVPMTVIPNGVSLAHFRPGVVDGDSVKRGLAIPDDAPCVGTCAVFRAQKRLDLWLEAAERVLQEVPKAHFILVGDGPLRPELEAAVARMSLGDRIHFSGLQDDVRPYLAAMDAYMMSSDFEGLPVALLEAMAMQLGIVATSVGGIPEVLRSTHNGIVVEPRRPDALASAIVGLLRSPSQRMELGRSARSTVEREFSVEQMISRNEALYDSLW